MIAKLVAGPLGPYLLPILLGAAILIAGASFYAAWTWQNDRKEAAVNEAVAKSVKEAQAAIDAERALTASYRNIAEGKVALLLEKLSKIKVQSVTITNNITKEVETNPAFYNQPLPQKGYDEWMNAKALLMPARAASAPTP